jgi:hypothetical protein
VTTPRDEQQGIDHDQEAFYNEQGEEISTDEWERLIKDKTYFKVSSDVLPDGNWVSTVWIGLNQVPGLSDTPMFFETMVFPSATDKAKEFDSKLYAALADAARTPGHDDTMGQLFGFWNWSGIRFRVALIEATPIVWSATSSKWEYLRSYLKRLRILGLCPFPKIRNQCVTGLRVSTLRRVIE